MAEAGSALLDVLYPRCCLACDDPVDGNSAYRFICTPCSRQLALIRDPCCGTCGYPFFGRMAENRACPHCVECKPRFGEGRAAVLMQGPGRRMVHGLKYRKETHVAEDMRRVFLATGRFVPFVRDAVLIPVPLHPRKERERGFNQSALIAGILAGENGTASVRNLLVRVRDTETQTHLDRAQRRDNLKNAFAITPGCSLNPKSRYVLVDDVFTTGATLNACATVLRKAGASSLDVVTFGHG